MISDVAPGLILLAAPIRASRDRAVRLRRFPPFGSGRNSPVTVKATVAVRLWPCRVALLSFKDWQRIYLRVEAEEKAARDGGIALSRNTRIDNDSGAKKIQVQNAASN